MKKTRLTLKNLLILAVLLACSAASQTLSLKADIGVCAVWDCVSLNVYELTGFPVGTFSIIGNSCFVLIQLLILRRDFPPIRFLQVGVALIFGVVVNLCYYHIFTFEVSGYPMRIVLCILSYLLLAIFVGGVTLINLAQTPGEGLCYILQERFGLNFSWTRMGLDLICICVSLLITLFFHTPLRVREGTIIGMVLLGPVMNWCMKWERPLLEKVLD